MGVFQIENRNYIGKMWGGLFRNGESIVGKRNTRSKCLVKGRGENLVKETIVWRIRQRQEVNAGNQVGAESDWEAEKFKTLSDTTTPFNKKGLLKPWGRKKNVIEISVDGGESLKSISSLGTNATVCWGGRRTASRDACPQGFERGGRGGPLSITG